MVDEQAPVTVTQYDQLTALQNSLNLNLANVPEFKGSPQEDIEKFLKEFSRATVHLSKEQKCLALKRAPTEDACLFLKNYLKSYITIGDWKEAKK